MKKRVFLAINLPDEIRKKVEKVSVNLADKLPEKEVKFNVLETFSFGG